ncbi:hypothetical protein [Streptomyces sp. NPDC001389]|uniref:hypothetical protein n=1 Tax=Streptomyces sp. NPDC001389 TaxID=3364569 RepID=UPI0036A56141
MPRPCHTPGWRSSRTPATHCPCDTHSSSPTGSPADRPGTPPPAPPPPFPASRLAPGLRPPSRERSRSSALTHIDHADITLGTTPDRGTFAAIGSARLARPATAILVRGGFTPHPHQGRSVYHLPPGPTAGAHLDTVAQAYNALRYHTAYIADLTSPQPAEPGKPSATPDVRIDLTTTPVQATVHHPRVHEVLDLYGWLPTAGRRSYVLPAQTSECDIVAITVMTKWSLYAVGAVAVIDLGIPSPAPAPVAGPTPAPARAASPRTR